MTTDFSIKTLTASHVPAALRFCREAGWNQLEQDWRRLVTYEPHGCFGAFHREQLVGTVTATTYGSDLAWIGMMLVDPDFRRQGIATGLMERAIGALRQRGVECIKLDATPEGEFVYSKLGFDEEWTFHRWQRDARATKRQQSKKPITATSFSEALMQVDREAFGTGRSEYLKLLIADSSIVVCDGGFGMVREGYLATYLGPVCATTPNVARTIILQLVESVNQILFWDIPSANNEAESIARDCGFAPVRTLKRMRLGTCSKSANLAMQYALADPATG